MAAQIQTALMHLGQALGRLDNAAFHKSDETGERVAATGATILFLPPYSPDLNPIEHDFASIKKTREFNENETLDNIIKMYN